MTILFVFLNSSSRFFAFTTTAQTIGKIMQLIFYSKPGCHLCEGLYEKLQQVQSLALEIEVRDITTREDWFNLYQYEIPVLCQRLAEKEQPLPRVSPRASIQQVEKMLIQLSQNQLGKPNPVS